MKNLRGLLRHLRCISSFGPSETFLSCRQENKCPNSKIEGRVRLKMINTKIAGWNGCWCWVLVVVLVWETMQAKLSFAPHPQVFYIHGRVELFDPHKVCNFQRLQLHREKMPSPSHTRGCPWMFLTADA